jgi:hypothetical protein
VAVDCDGRHTPSGSDAEAQLSLFRHLANVILDDRALSADANDRAYVKVVASQHHDIKAVRDLPDPVELRKE